jgi:hypothetical protein
MADIYRGTDLIIRFSMPEDFDGSNYRAKAAVYTTDKSSALTFLSSNGYSKTSGGFMLDDEDLLLMIPSTVLAGLKDGAIKYVLNIGIPNSYFPDSYQDDISEGSTGMNLKDASVNVRMDS